jgi:hypothetical protein
MQRIRGFLDKVTSEGVVGWAFCVEDDEPAELILRVDGHNVTTFEATLHRPDLQLFNVHPTGLCGFDLKFDDVGCDLPKHAKVEVTSSDFLAQPLHNSPWFHYDPEYIDELEQSEKVLHPENVIVVGMPKSGTSMLAFRIKDSLETDNFSFEPFGRQALRHVDFHKEVCKGEKAVTKALFYSNHSNHLDLCGSFYGKRILLLRDPRDVLISSFFYSWNKHDQPPVDKLEEMMGLLRKKESHPGQVAFEELLAYRPDVQTEIVESAVALAELIEHLKQSWYVVHCEKLLFEESHDLIEYLGFPLSPVPQDQNQLKRLQRSKKGNAWRRWLTDQDVRDWKPVFSEILHCFGYDGDDWNISHPDMLDPAEGSEFVEALQRQ